MLSTTALGAASLWGPPAFLPSALSLSIHRTATASLQSSRRRPLLLTQSLRSPLATPSAIRLLSSSLHRSSRPPPSSCKLLTTPFPASRLHQRVTLPPSSPLSSPLPSPFHVELVTALLYRALSSAAPATKRAPAPSSYPTTPRTSRAASAALIEPLSSAPSHPITARPPPLPTPHPTPATPTPSPPSPSSLPNLTPDTSASPHLSAVLPTPTLSSASPGSSLLGTLASPPPTRAQRLWTRVKKEVRHYVDGTKLLAAEIKIAWGLTLQVLNGHELNRRERKQLTRTSADILRLVPFLVIVIVPFMEFALPVLLKLFPNMLPSTYLDHKGEEAKLKKQLAAKIEMARFLQDTTALMARQLLERDATAADSDERQVTVSSFNALMDKVRRGESVKNAEILAVSRLFDEDFTLDNLNHQQLAAMCRLLDLRVFGSDWVLRYKLNKKLDELRDDDKIIQKEGVDSLTLQELQEACRARGIHSERSEEYMRRKLNDWLELSLEHDVPISLLVLSRAFSVSLAGVRDIELSEGLAETLKYIPEVVVQDTQQAIVDRSDDAREKLQLIRKEEQETKRTKPAIAAPSPVATPTVVGLTEIKEALEEVKEENDELEAEIDEALAVEAKEEAKVKVTAAEADAGAIPLPAEPAASSREVVQAGEVKPEGVDVEKAKEKVVEKKKVQKVDVLNDRVEALLDRVQAELQQHEQQQQVEQQQQNAASTTPATAATTLPVTGEQGQQQPKL